MGRVDRYELAVKSYDSDSAAYYDGMRRAYVETLDLLNRYKGVDNGNDGART